MSIKSKVGFLIHNFKNKIISMRNKRDYSIVLFGAWFGDRFADNSRYLYQYLSDHKKELGLSHVIWVTRNDEICSELCDMGYESYLIDSERSLYYHKKAGWHIVCNSPVKNGSYEGDILGEYSFGANKINLWHGVMPMKKVGLATDKYKETYGRHPVLFSIKHRLMANALFREIYLLPGGWGDCFYLSCTPSGTEIMSKYFRLPHSHFIETGLPRLNMEPVLTPSENEIIQIIKQYDRIVLYLPTFRNATSTFNASAVATELESFLKKENILLIQKMHSADLNNRNSILSNDIVNILSLNSNFDVNVLMSKISILITDYSSVAADAMYYKKPIIYYIPDYDEYISKDSGFVLNPNSVMCGIKAHDLIELKQAIITALSREFVPDDFYLSTREKYCGMEKSPDDIWNDLVNRFHRR